MEPVGLGVKPQDAFVPIKNVLDITGAAQAQQLRGLEIEKSNIALGERKAIQDLYQNNAHTFTDAQGKVDYNKLIHEGMRVAPTTFPTMVPQIITAHREGLAAQKTLNELDNQNRDALGQAVGGLSDDPRVAQQQMGALVKLRPQLAPVADVMWKYMLGPAAQNPETFKAAKQKVMLGVMSPQQQAEAAQPTYTDTGAALVQTKPTATGAPQTLPKTVAPGSLETIETDALGNKHIVSRSPQGSILSSRPVPGSTPVNRGGGAGNFTSFEAGDKEDIPKVTELRDKAATAASKVPTQRFNNRQIIQLSSTDGLNTSGTLAGKWSAIASAVGVPWGSDYATNFNNLGHYLALQAQSYAEQMGAGTDQARELAGAISGKVDMTPTALQNIAKVNDAFSVGTLNFSTGMQKAIERAGGNVLAARDFQRKWAQSFDPDVYRYGNALEAGDTKEIDHILGKPGTKERAARARALAEKSARLNALVNGGQ